LLINEVVNEVVSEPVNEPVKAVSSKLMINFHFVIQELGRESKMQPFSFTIRKPKDVESALSTLQAAIQKSGGSISGDSNRGRIKSSGVEGIYEVGADAIKITVEKKPFIVSRELIEKTIKSEFEKAEF
jgi:hypothetical protein